MKTDTGANRTMPVLKPSHEFAPKPPAEWEHIECASKVLNDLAWVIRDAVVNLLAKGGTSSPFYADVQRDEQTALELDRHAAELFQSACDHAMAVAALVSYPVHRFAGYTCSRSVLDACANTSWLIDSAGQVDTEARFRRLFQSQLDGVNENEKRIELNPRLVQHLDCSKEEFKDICRRAIDQIIANADRAGIEPIPPKDEKSKERFLNSKPTISSLVDHYFDRNLIQFQFYSGVVHGKEADITVLATWSHHKSDRNLIEFKPRETSHLVYNAGQWLLKTWERYFVYHGWWIQDFEDTRDHYSQRIADCDLLVFSAQQNRDILGMGMS